MTFHSEQLTDAVNDLLDFIVEKYPRDFQQGGPGFRCPHHQRLAQLVDHPYSIYGEAWEAYRLYYNPAAEQDIP